MNEAGASGVGVLNKSLLSDVDAESENDLADQVIYSRYEKHIEPFWNNNMVNGYLNGKGAVQIAYAFVIHPDPSGSIVICSGRIETLLKYKELVFNLYNAGYSVFIHDHRGQGLSGRSTVNLHKGYVDSFDDYVSDLYTFVNNVVTPNSITKPLLLCHSMGGAIGAQYLLTHPDDFSRCVFSAPMFGIKPALPIWLAVCLVKIHLFINSIFSTEPWYFLGQADYTAKTFEQNELTHSRARYAIFRREYDAQKGVKLGGVTNRWLCAALKSIHVILLRAKEIRLPILLLQAEQDEVVDNKSQIRISALLPHCKTVVLPDAKHEILMETDEIRDKCLREILDFFDLKQS